MSEVGEEMEVFDELFLVDERFVDEEVGEMGGVGRGGGGEEVVNVGFLSRFDEVQALETRKDEAGSVRRSSAVVEEGASKGDGSEIWKGDLQVSL